MSRVAHSDDGYAGPLVPLESVGRGAVPSLRRVCRAIPGLARMDGNPPFQLQQSFPVQHQTMVYSMQPNLPLRPGNREHPLGKHHRGQRWSL